MPDGSGIEAAESITQQVPGVAVVLFVKREEPAAIEPQQAKTLRHVGDLVPSNVGGADVEVERFSQCARLLGAIEHHDRPRARGQRDGLQQIVLLGRAQQLTGHAGDGRRCRDRGTVG